jgi:hypothetical protein
LEWDGTRTIMKGDVAVLKQRRMGLLFVGSLGSKLCAERGRRIAFCRSRIRGVMKPTLVGMNAKQGQRRERLNRQGWVPGCMKRRASGSGEEGGDLSSPTRHECSTGVGGSGVIVALLSSSTDVSRR